MTNFYMMIGLPGSGKSYYCNQLGCEVVSSDAIREELFGDVNDQTHNNEVFNEVHNRIHNFLKSGTDCCYDATNLSRKRRRAFLNTVPKNVHKTAIMIVRSFDECVKNNNNRDRVVPIEVIERMFKHLTIPALEEGFDEIRFIIEHDEDFAKNVAVTFGYDQDNPNHSITLNSHMLKACQYPSTIKDNLTKEEVDILTLACFYHDIGKPICKTYTLFNGKEDDHAHYYNHAEVGAYLFLTSCFDNITITKENRFPSVKNHWATFNDALIAELIRAHMDFYGDENCLEKYKITHGEQFAKLLGIVHDADMNAH